MINLNCFKAYDIRGRVPDELNEALAWCIGHAYAQEINPSRVVIGHDARLESPALAQAVTHGLNAAGVEVIDIGLCGTEEVYFHTFHREKEGVGGGIMITASHNPKGFNGMKLVREGARPISGDSGLFAIRDRAATLLARGGADKGAIQQNKITIDIDKSHYIQHLLNYVDLSSLRPLRIVADPGNGTAGLIIRQLQHHLPFEFILIQEEPDGNFPKGVPNPLLPEMREMTRRAVIEHGADFGIAWDGDFDRCFLFDAQGRFIEGYYLVGLIAEMTLRKHPNSKIIHDPRLTWNTVDVVRKAGGVAIQSKTGHAFIKERMRKEDAIYGGEMSAHHYFRDFAYCDSGMIPWLLIAELISKTGQSLSELVDERVASYPCSGEINYTVDNMDAVIDRVLEFYAPKSQVIDRTDGLSMEFNEWRFNLRGSNTEPLLRLNVESRGDAALVAAKVMEIQGMLT